jgi:hypothetical protein
MRCYPLSKEGISMKALKLLCGILTISQIACAHLATAQTHCMDDHERQKSRSEELQRIVTEDQNDRLAHPIDWNIVYPRDVVRIKRVGEIYAEGCFVTGQDYAAAALVFQHGDSPDHYLQVYLWEVRAIELGDTADHPDLKLSGLDRYLVNTGHKQLFATQYSTIGAEHCRCLQKIEESFSEKRRLKLGGKTTLQALEFVSQGNVGRPACKDVTFCDITLKPTDKTTLPFVAIW